MLSEDVSVRWLAVAEEALVGMATWRRDHPSATWTQIETELDDRLARLRGQVLRDTAQASPRADFRGAVEHPPCPACSTPLRAVGQHRRRLVTDREQMLDLERSYGRCPHCGTGVFPPR